MQNDNFKQLQVWRKSIDLVELVYQLVRELPKDEKYILGVQILRAVVSIPSNIAEGFGRVSKKDKKHFYQIAYSSCLEVETQLEIIKRIYNNIPSNQQNNLVIEIQKMLRTYMSRIEC